MQVVTIETPELGDRSYVVGEGGPGSEALVVDPQRDLDRVEAVLAERGWTCVLVVDTHLHNDYVSGALELARRTGATYGLQGREEVAFERCAIHDGDILSVGTLEVRALETPGHTENHVSLVVGHHGQPTAVFSGGALLYGSVGRTDLVHADRTEHLAHAQFHSARRLAHHPDDTALYPTHGFGSMCSAGPSSGADASTIGAERQSNEALTTPDEDDYVAGSSPGSPPTRRTTPTWDRETPPDPPARTCHRPSMWTRTRSPSASRPGSGSWTCVTAPPTPPSTWPAASASRWASSSPPTSAG